MSSDFHPMVKDLFEDNTLGKVKNGMDNIISTLTGGGGNILDSLMGGGEGGEVDPVELNGTLNIDDIKIGDGELFCRYYYLLL